MAGAKSTRCFLFVAIVVLHLSFLLEYSTDLQVGWKDSQHNNDNNKSALPSRIETSEVTASIKSTFTTRSSMDPRHFGPRLQIFHDKIDNIRLLGERHSGTTYLTRYLQDCFPKNSVNDFLVRKKHWFQPSPIEIVAAVQSVDAKVLDEATEFHRFERDQRSWRNVSEESNPKGIFQTSLVVYVVRDVYQWMEAMRQRPWHWPNHLHIQPKNESTVATMKYDPAKDGLKRNRKRRRLAQTPQIDGLMRKVPKGAKYGDILPGSIRIQKSFVTANPLPWEEFVQAPLRIIDEPIWKSAKICQKGFPPNTISPCAQNHSYVPPSIAHIPRAFLRHLPYSVNDAIYELQADGQPFPHPLALRATKIIKTLELPHIWDLGGFLLIRYEDVLNGKDKATNLNSLVEEIANILGVTSHCPAQTLIAKTPHVLADEFESWIGDHADWDIEKILGYSRIN